ncbi:MAG TPA: 3-hydroxyacyl-CoA dehydrogenase NAD-binding domain-containing protein [Steroidobacteraceae bacterium]|jgi:3-hydroxyacyl-CoA dehydrogenase/enoyl-CoA hydratase/3-hydroxybutyryl-CoA epimerase|nr:3-hydroxyacyl-CoA dehydrogenase NAD-binding domain-containing protein [Steroidobacteraceae bacterium]
MSSAIRFEIDGDGVATLYWQLQGTANTLRPETMRDLEAAVDRVMVTPAIKGTLLTGTGNQFVGGLDLAWLLDATSPERSDDDESLLAEVLRLNAVLRRIETSDKPFVAAINGDACGAALELALACHRRIAGKNCQLGFTDVKLGLPPSAGGALRLTRMVGAPQAAGLLENGQLLSTIAAHKAGLIDELVPADELLVSARRWVLLSAAQRMQHPVRAAIKAMLADDLGVPMDAALHAAATRFVEVARGPVARQMTRTLGLSMARASDLARRPRGFAKRTFRKVGVLGAGLMGGGVALVAARAGLEVVLLDVTQAAAERGLAKLRQQEEAAIAAGRIDQRLGHAALARITATDSYEALRDVDLVVEAVFEDRAVKAEATQRAEAAISRQAVFATNTSTLPISGLAQESVRPAQFVGLHFFSPVPRMPLLEIIRGKITSDETLATAMDFAQAIGKTPIVVNDARGFYTTRVVMAYQAESFDMLAQGVAPDLVELAGAASGMPVPPLALSDAVALDLIHQINLQAAKDLGAAYQQTPGYAMVGRMVEELGRNGKKVGKGFYDYREDGTKQLWPGLHAMAAEGAVQFASIDDLRDRLLAAQALETARCLEEGVITDPSEADVGALLGWGFAPWTGGPLSYIDAQGPAAFVARCDELAERYGSKRLQPPEMLRRIAADGGTIYGTTWQLD